MIQATLEPDGTIIVTQGQHRIDALKRLTGPMFPFPMATQDEPEPNLEEEEQAAEKEEEDDEIDDEDLGKSEDDEDNEDDDDEEE